MVRVMLGSPCNVADVAGVKVALDTSCAPPDVVVDEPPVEPPRIMEIRQRTRVGYDEEGAPAFSWSPITVGASMLWEQRVEYDAEAGLTVVTADAMLTNDSGMVDLPETCVVVETVNGEERMWRVTRSRVLPDRFEFSLVRIDQEGGDGGPMIPEEPGGGEVYTGNGPPGSLDLPVGSEYVDLDTGAVYEMQE